MAEFLTMAEAEDKFGKKGRTNAALTLGIIGTALGAFAGNNGGCGCGNGGGLLGNLFGGNNNCCAMQQAEQAKTLAMAPSIAPLYCSPFTSYGTGMYAGTAAANFNAVNTAINTVADRCPSCTAQ